MFKIGLLRKISPPLTIKELVALANETREKQATILVKKDLTLARCKPSRTNNKCQTCKKACKYFKDIRK